MTAILKSIASKLAALSVTLAALVAFAVTVAAPLYERWQDANDKIAQNRVLLGRYLAAAGAQVDATGAVVADGVYLEGETEALKLANLQARISADAKAHGVRLASIRQSEIETREGVNLLGLHAQLSTELSQLQGLLYDVEAKEKGLFVHMLHILRGPRSEGLTLPSLDVSLVVAGAVPGKEK